MEDPRDGDERLPLAQPGPGKIPKRPERTAASFFVTRFARSWASVVPLFETAT